LLWFNKPFENYWAMNYQRNKKCRININSYFKYIFLNVGSDCWLYARTVEDFVEQMWLMFAPYRGVSQDYCHLNCSITRITCRVTLSSSKRACRTWMPLSWSRFLPMALTVSTTAFIYTLYKYDAWISFAVL